MGVSIEPARFKTQWASFKFEMSRFQYPLRQVFIANKRLPVAAFLYYALGDLGACAGVSLCTKLRRFSAWDLKSVSYQPVPFNRTAAAVIWRETSCPLHWGQLGVGASIFESLSN